MLKQFLKFIVAGVAAAAANFAVYNLLLWAFSGWRWEYTYVLAQLISYFISILVTFALSRRFVFNSPEERQVHWFKALLRMIAVYSFTGIVLNSMLSVLWVEVLLIPKTMVSILNDITAGPVNFLMNKFWAFREKKKVC